jgi:hypothetical protein
MSCSNRSRNRGPKAAQVCLPKREAPACRFGAQRPVRLAKLLKRHALTTVVSLEGGHISEILPIKRVRDCGWMGSRQLCGLQALFQTPAGACGGVGADSSAGFFHVR